MPCYSFNSYGGGGHFDHGSRDFAGTKEVRTHMLALAFGLLAKNSDEQDWELEASNEEGEVVATMIFDEKSDAPFPSYVMRRRSDA